MDFELFSIVVVDVIDHWTCISVEVLVSKCCAFCSYMCCARRRVDAVAKPLVYLLDGVLCRVLLRNGAGGWYFCCTARIAFFNVLSNFLFWAVVEA